MHRAVLNSKDNAEARKEIVRELGLVDYWRTGRLHEHPVLNIWAENYFLSAAPG
jgi:hypothetical protein